MHAGLAAFLLFTAAFAGCVAPGRPAALPTQSSIHSGPRVVVGLVDSGILPYHEVFQDAQAELPADFVDARTGQRPIALELSTTGSLQERFEKDRQVWASIETGKLYWFKGTRVLAMSLVSQGGDGVPLVWDTEGHGTATSSVVRAAAPGAWIVMVQNPNFEATTNGLTFDPIEKAADGVQWFAEQPWVDVLSLSIGFVGNLPLPAWKGFEGATHEAVVRGKPVVVAAGNEPVPSILPGNSGPPWVISVGGAQGESEGGQPQSGPAPDVVADFFTRAAKREPNDYGLEAGTSLSTPVVAGNLARTLYELRNATHETAGADGVLCRCAGRNVTNVVLRDALNRTAVYFNTTDYQPQNAPGDPLFQIAFATAPVLPTPWAQMGWGYVGNDTWRGMVAGLLAGKLPERDALAKTYMAEQYGAREAYWRLPHD